MSSFWTSWSSISSSVEVDLREECFRGRGGRKGGRQGRMGGRKREREGGREGGEEEREREGPLKLNG